MSSSGNTSTALRTFFTEGTKLTFKKGEFVIRTEDTPEGVFFVDTGYVKAVSATKYGEENLLAMRKPGEIFPLIWMVTGDNRGVGYEAHTDVTVYRRSAKELEEITNNSTAIMKEILLVTTLMYQSQAERVSSLAYRTVRERIAYFLKTLQRRFGSEHPDGILIDVPMTRQDIAASISATRETVSREFSALSKRGVVKQVDGHILVVQPEYLESLL